MPRQAKFLEPKPTKEQLFIPPTHGKRKVENISEAMAGMQRGEGRTGFLDDGNIVRKPDYLPPSEVLDKPQQERKKALQEFLAAKIQPVSLGSKSTPEMDKRSLVNKLRKRSLADLELLMPDCLRELTTEQLRQVAVGASGTDETAEAELQDRYMDISP